MNTEAENTRILLHVALFAAVTTVLSFVRIPIPLSPVPITGQTLGTMMAGLFLGARYGGLSQLVYVLAGLTGMPVFGGAGGFSVLLGPGGGYLVGMIVGAALTGRVAGRSDGAGRMLLSCLIGGVLAVYIPGVLWLSHVTGVPLQGALVAGALPYIPGDVLKCLAAVSAARKLRGYQLRRG